MYHRSHYYYLLATSIQNIFDIFISITIPYQKQSAINSTLTFTAKNRKQNKKKTLQNYLNVCGCSRSAPITLSLDYGDSLLTAFWPPSNASSITL